MRISNDIMREIYEKIKTPYKYGAVIKSDEYLTDSPSVFRYNGKWYMYHIMISVDMFKAAVRRYTRVRKLTPRMLNEMIEKIEVHQSEKINGKTVQKLTIHYNCIGAIDIPNLDKIPENNISVHTRKGVDVNFEAYAS